MNNQKIKDIKESSTNIFSALTKKYYVEGLDIYREQEEHDFLASIMLEKDRKKSYILHIKNYVAKHFDEYMEELGKNERLMYVDMDRVIIEMRLLHMETLLFIMTQ